MISVPLAGAHGAASALDADARAMLVDGFRRFSRDRPRHGDAALNVRAEWNRLAEQGWLALGLPEEHGGYGPAIGDLTMLLRAAGEGDWRVPLIECLGAASGALLAAPVGPVRDRLLSEIGSGQAIVGLAQSDTDADRAMFTARPCGSRFRITGFRRSMAAGGAWTHVLVTAQRSPQDGSANLSSKDDEVSLYVVEATAPGVQFRDFAALDGRLAADISITDAPAELIAERAEKSSAAARHRAQLLAAAEVVGIAHTAFEATRRHLAQRRQFGQPILTFQAIQHRMVGLYLGLRELAALLAAAQAAYDEQRPGIERLLWQLRAQASLTGRRVTQQAIQLHGGMGMTAEMPLGDYYKRVIQIDSLYDSHAAALDRLAKTLPLQKE